MLWHVLAIIGHVSFVSPGSALSSILSRFGLAPTSAFIPAAVRRAHKKSTSGVRCVVRVGEELELVKVRRDSVAIWGLVSCSFDGALIHANRRLTSPAPNFDE